MRITKFIINIMLFLGVATQSYAKIEIVQVNQSTNGECNGSIEILAEGSSGPFTLIINNGTPINDISGNYTFENLCSGYYEIIVIDFYGCEVILSAATGCGEIIADIDFEVGCLDIDRYATVVVNPNAPPPFSFIWSNGATTQTISNFPQGKYCVTVTDGGGCSEEKCVYIRKGRVGGTVTNVCGGGSDGEITVGSIFGLPGPYSYEWSTGETSVTISNLSVGTYTVTITDGNGCPFPREFKVKDDQTSILITNKVNPTFCTGFQSDCTGSITLGGTSGSGYTYAWTGPNGFTSSLKNISGLCPGNYSVTATSGSGCTSVKSTRICCCSDDSFEPGVPPSPYLCNSNVNTPQPLEINATVFSFVTSPGANDGRISASATGGLGLPIHQQILTWTGPNGFISNSNIIENLEPGKYCVSITDGCYSASECYDILPCGKSNNDNLLWSAFVDESSVVNPCDGLNDGVVGLVIPNYSGNNITVTLDGFIDVPVSSNTSQAKVNLSGLEPHKTYNVEIVIGECIFNFSFDLDAESSVTTFQYEEDDICNFTRTCNGTSLGTYQENSLINYQQGYYNVKCKAPIICEGGYVLEEDKKLDKIKTRGYKYFARLNALISAYPHMGILNQRLDEYYALGIDHCQRVKYCEGNMQIIKHDFPGNPLLISFVGFEDPDANGCVGVNCSGPFNDFDVCPDDLPSVFNFENCIPRRASVLQLYNNMNQLEADYPNNFSGSPLHLFLLEHGSKPEAACASVTFCLNNFKKLYDNLDQVVCGIDVSYANVVLESCNYNNVFTDLDGSQFVVVPCFYNYSTEGQVNVFSLGELNLLQSDPTNELTFQVIADSQLGETLDGFGFSTKNGYTIPNGFVQSSKGKYLYEYSATTKVVRKIKSINIKHYIDDWDTESSVYIETRKENQEHGLIYEGLNSDWEKQLFSKSGEVDVLHLSKTKEEIIVGGSFISDLGYNGNIVASSSTLSSFILRITLKGDLIDVQKIENMHPEIGIAFSVTNDGRPTIVAGYKGESVLINDQATVFSEKNGIILSRFDEQGKLDIVNKILGEKEMKVLDVAYSVDKTQITLALEGQGSLVIDEKLIYSNNKSNVVILTIDSNSGELIWQRDINSQSINTDKFDMIYGDGNELFIGITYTGFAKMGDIEIKGIGKEDIGLFKVSSKGDVLWGTGHGSTEDENVSQLFYDHSVLFFGGEFDGNLSERMIGQYKFVNITGSHQRAYISYIKDERAVRDGRVMGRSSNDNPHINEVAKQTMDVFPNPFKENINIRIFDSNITQIKIYNALGQLIQSESVGERKVLEFNFQNNDSGIFYIQGLNANGNTIGKEKILKLN